MFVVCTSTLKVGLVCASVCLVRQSVKGPSNWTNMDINMFILPSDLMVLYIYIKCVAVCLFVLSVTVFVPLKKERGEHVTHIVGSNVVPLANLLMYCTLVYDTS